MASKLTAHQVIMALNLKPHPEKGFFIETFRDKATVPSPSPSSTTTSSPNTNTNTTNTPPRAHSTCIYYLLEGTSGRSHWHRVRDAVEVWHHYAGAPLRLSLAWDDGSPIRDVILGTDLLRDERPQVVVRRNEWQHAVCLGEWTLVGCSVAPAFTFESFQMAEPGWEPNRGEARPPKGKGKREGGAA